MMIMALSTCSLFEVLDDQREEEIKRRQQMELLFSEEAQKMWDKQEKVWQSEAEARKKLMDDVLETLGRQTREKLEGKTE